MNKVGNVALASVVGVAGVACEDPRKDVQIPVWDAEVPHECHMNPAQLAALRKSVEDQVFARVQASLPKDPDAGVLDAAVPAPKVDAGPSLEEIEQNRKAEVAAAVDQIVNRVIQEKGAAADTAKDLLNAAFTGLILSGEDLTESLEREYYQYRLREDLIEPILESSKLNIILMLAFVKLDKKNVEFLMDKGLEVMDQLEPTAQRLVLNALLMALPEIENAISQYEQGYAKLVGHHDAYMVDFEEVNERHFTDYLYESTMPKTFRADGSVDSVKVIMPKDKVCGDQEGLGKHGDYELESTSTRSVLRRIDDLVELGFTVGELRAYVAKVRQNLTVNADKETGK